MKDPLKIGLVVALLVFAGSVAALMFLNSRGPAIQNDGPAGAPADGNPASPDENAADLTVLPFSFTAHDGATVTNEAFKGCITVLDFTFTRCTLICPKMTGTMFELYQKLKHPQVRFLSISVDPEHDTPAVNAERAKQLEVASPKWRFLTGDKAKVFSMLTDGLKFGITEREPLKLPDGKTAPDIRHPPHFFLIGPDGRVLGFYDSNDDSAVERMVTRIGAIAKRLGP